MAKRIIHWFTYNVVLGLLPFLASIILHFFAGKPIVDSIVSSPELLFFSLLVCSVTLGDLSNLNTKKATLPVTLMYSSSLLGAVFSAILYGSFLQDSILNGLGSAFQTRVLAMSVWMSLVFLFLTTIAQIAIARKEANR